FNGNDSDFGWGINLGGSFKITENNTVMFLGVYGHGVGGMGNDTSFVNSDAAFDADGNLVALRYYSAMGAFTHNWTPRLRSTVTYGYANLANTDLQPGNAYHSTHYASGNLIFQIFKRLSIGVEGLYGRREVKDGRTGD